MILILEIGLVVFGFIALIRGKFTITKNKVVEGVPARLLGLLALVPLPLALMIGVVIGVMKGEKAERFIEDNKLTISLGEAAIVILFAVLVFGIGAAIGKPPKKKRRRRDEEDDEEDEDDDRPRRRNRRVKEEDEADEEEDDRPRKRRRRDEDDEDEEDERPRRRGNDR